MISKSKIPESTKRPELSTMFDSDIADLDADHFLDVLYNSQRLFFKNEIDAVAKILDDWDTQSLCEIERELNGFLFKSPGSGMKWITNLLLDHCMDQDVDSEKPELNLAKVIVLLDITEELLRVRREIERMRAQLGGEEG